MTEEARMKETLTVDVISDVVCPWCYIGQKRLDQAIALTPDIDVQVRWRPYQLDATIPKDGVDRRQYMMAKFGSAEKLGEIHQRVTAVGAAEGIDFHFDDIAVSPNTLDAHRVIRWAQTAGDGVQHEVVKQLFSAFFEDARNIGDPKVLADVAGKAGMDARLVETLLPTHADREEVEGEVATASRMGVTGVPCFLIESRYAVMGAQDAETLADALRKIAEAKSRGELDTAAG
jgi:predicted DsbA family dithiol-disulfide isomerase